MKRMIALACLAWWGGNLTANEVVKLELDRAQEPISKYIYGQFIEHLGRCIYGGLWAEMLEDRKFYYPVTDQYHPWGTDTDRQWNAGEYRFLNGSPWKVIGPPGTVLMDTNHPFVGRHTPVIKLAGDGSRAGIAQEGLAMVGGRKYAGHIVLAGEPTAAPVLLRVGFPGGGTLEIAVRKIGPEFKSEAFHFTAPMASDNATIEVVSQGKGAFKIGTLSLMPADNVKGWRPEVVALLKELDAPIYRWPGGNFVSGYNWKDGLGERDRRPPRKNPAWKGVEPNDVGVHEYMELMELIGTEPYVAVNTGLGTVEDVAAEVEYFNGSRKTPMGKLRAQNGHSAPYKAQWWAVGNEMYGDWQLGHMPLAEYVKKHNRVADAMWKVDPSIKLVGVGAVGDWSKTMLTVCASNLTLLSEHIYCKEKPDVIEHTAQLAQDIHRVANAHREYRKTIPELAGKDVRIAMDEWNYWYGDYIYGELGVRYHHKDGLGVARGLHEYFRHSDLYFMANYAQTVNVIGCIKTTRTAAAFETTGLVLKLYRRHFGTIPIEIARSTGPLDVAAAWTANKSAVTVAIVNPTKQAEQVAIETGGRVFREKARVWSIVNADPESSNEPGKEPNVVIHEEPVTVSHNTLSSPAYSIVLYRLDLN